MNLEECLVDLIGMYDNDVSCGIKDLDERNKAKVLLGEVIILLTKIQLGIKCCSREDCPASPKVELKRVINSNEYELKKLIPYEINYDFILSLC